METLTTTSTSTSSTSSTCLSASRRGHRESMFAFADETDVEEPLLDEKRGPEKRRVLRWLSLLAQWVWTVVRFVIPSFLRSKKEAVPSSGRTTAQLALDGLRGLACLLVSWYHFFGNNYEINHGYFWDNEKPNGGDLASLWNLPFINIVHSGPNMVAIFFIISGYVLTHRFLTLVHQDKSESALMSMSSATFRRFVRLYGPLLVFTAIMQVFIQLGLFEHGRLRYDNKTPYPPKADTISGQFFLFWTWWRDAVDPFRFDLKYNETFDGNIWTIPIEYRCSMVLFLVAVGLARVKTKLQIPFMVIIMAWAMNTVHWEVILFLIGMALAQIDVLLLAKKESLTPCGVADQDLGWRTKWLWFPVISVAIYLCSVPWFHDNALGFVFLSQIDPFPIARIFNTWGVLGATIVVVSALHWPLFQRFLNWSPIQYLGQVSYPLYIVHGSLVRLATYSLKWDVFELLKPHFQPGDDEILHTLCVWISFFCFMPSLIVLSDMFWRGVDTPFVNLSHRLWKYCTT